MPFIYIAGCQTKIDVAFLIDVAGSSDKVVHGRMLSVSQGITEMLNISPRNTRVAMATFKDSAKVQFHLNEYNSKEQVLSAMMFDRHRGNSDPRRGLDIARNSMYTSARGNRQDAPNYIILLTDGTRDIRPDTMRLADDIKGNGNNEATWVFVVAFGNYVDHKKMSELASRDVEPFYLRVQSDKGVNKAIEQITTEMCQIVP